MSGKTRILFLCTGNSCRSQMAEGWARHLKADVIEPFSAGIEKHGLNPLAADARTDEEALTHYLRVRDEIRAFVETLPDALEVNHTS